MNCPYCQKPVNLLSLITSFGGVRVCSACNKKYVVKYNYMVGAIVIVAGLAMSTVALTMFFPSEPSWLFSGPAGIAILVAAALIAGRSEKHDG